MAPPRKPPEAEDPAPGILELLVGPLKPRRKGVHLPHLVQERAIGVQQGPMFLEPNLLHQGGPGLPAGVPGRKTRGGVFVVCWDGVPPGGPVPHFPKVPVRLVAGPHAVDEPEGQSTDPRFTFRKSRKTFLCEIGEINE